MGWRRFFEELGKGAETIEGRALREQREELEKQKIATQEKAEVLAKRATYKFKRRRRSLFGSTSMVSGNELGTSNFKLGSRSILNS